MRNDKTPLIVAETNNGSGFTKNAYICYGEADFISRISKLAARSGEDIDSVESAVEYLDERYAQRTALIFQADFAELTPDSWDTPILDCAESLGWYTTPEEADEE